MRTRITPNTDTYHVVYQISLQQPHYSQNIKSILAMLYCGIGARDICVACVRFTPLTSDLKLQIISDKDVDVLFEVSVTHLWQKWYVKCLLIRIEYLSIFLAGFLGICTQTQHGNWTTLVKKKSMSNLPKNFVPTSHSMKMISAALEESEFLIWHYALRKNGWNTGQLRFRIAPNTDTFYAVIC